jgi:hypothetical protein
MKFLVDESIDRQVVDQLRIDGHEVWYVTESDQMSGRLLIEI